MIDEVRYSDAALSEGELLNVIPEPSSFALLLGITAVSWVSMSRRRK
ncbi:PEP-CTERM sorting domain-containing protein [Coraliomargarita algicola]